jgi:hypothetical protein
MPEKSTVEAARKDIKEGKSASTAAGEFVRQEQEHVREGKHGARQSKDSSSTRSPPRQWRRR